MSEDKHVRIYTGCRSYIHSEWNSSLGQKAYFLSFMQRPRSGKESNNYKNDRGGPTLIDQAANFVAACLRTQVTTIAIVITKGNTVSLFRWCLLHVAAVSNLHNNHACNNEHVEYLNAIPLFVHYMYRLNAEI